MVSVGSPRALDEERRLWPTVRWLVDLSLRGPLTPLLEIGPNLESYVMPLDRTGDVRFFKKRKGAWGCDWWWYKYVGSRVKQKKRKGERKSKERWDSYIFAQPLKALYLPYSALPQRNVSISAKEIRRIEPEISEQQAKGTPSTHRQSQVEVTQLLKGSNILSHRLYWGYLWQPDTAEILFLLH